MSKLQINKGDKFGKLTVIKEAERLILPSGQKNRAILCKCDCGNEKVIRLLHLVRGRIKTCGCLNEKHNLSHKPLYRCWRSMKERCYLKSYINADRYSGRNITVCDEWNNSFLSFKEWALNNGYDENLRIDRINNNDGYSPNNCRFVTNQENVNNREITFKVNYDGIEYAFMDLMRFKNIDDMHFAAIRTRIMRGWNHKKAIDTPIRNGNYKNRYNTKVNC
jgi:hypothetical protein